jgi:hypothetical protein
MSEQEGGFNFKWIIYGALGLFFIYRIFSGGGSSSGDDYIEQTIEEPTQGILVELQETEKDLFKITNEELLAKRDDSQIIATYLDKSIDTFSIDEVRLSEANDPRRSLLRTAAYAGLLGYAMGGRSMSSGLSRSAYASDNAYSKSSTSGKTGLRSTARKSTVRTPRSSSSYGGRKSTKSYGG